MIEIQTCNHKNSESLFITNGYSIINCKDCGLRKIYPIPLDKEIDKIYNEEFYFGRESRRFKAIGEILVKFFRFLRAFEIYIFYRPKSVLDIGCGRGLMLYYLKKYFKVPYVSGTQYSETAIRYAKEKLGLDIKKGNLAYNIASIKDHLDVICFWHVLEHIDNVDLYINLSYKLLKKGGKLLIEVPNSESFSKKLTSSFWMGWDPPNHLTHFTSHSLTMLLERHGFKIIKKKYFSLEYSIFVTVQSILNKISKRCNLFYNFLLIGGKRPRLTTEIIGHILLFIIITPFAFAINLIFCKSDLGEILHYVACKE